MLKAQLKRSETLLSERMSDNSMEGLADDKFVLSNLAKLFLPLMSTLFV